MRRQVRVPGENTVLVELTQDEIPASTPVPVQQGITGLQERAGGAGDGSALKTICRSCRVPEFSSQHWAPTLTCIHIIKNAINLILKEQHE